MIGQHEILYSATDFMADGRDEGGEEKARQMVVKLPQQPKIPTQLIIKMEATPIVNKISLMDFDFTCRISLAVD